MSKVFIGKLEKLTDMAFEMLKTVSDDDKLMLFYSEDTGISIELHKKLSALQIDTDFVKAADEIEQSFYIGVGYAKGTIELITDFKLPDEIKKIILPASTKKKRTTRTRKTEQKKVSKNIEASIHDTKNEESSNNDIKNEESEKLTIKKKKQHERAVEVASEDAIKKAESITNIVSEPLSQSGSQMTVDDIANMFQNNTSKYSK